MFIVHFRIYRSFTYSYITHCMKGDIENGIIEALLVHYGRALGMHTNESLRTASPAASDEEGNTWDPELRRPAWKSNTEPFVITQSPDSHQTLRSLAHNEPQSVINDLQTPVHQRQSRLEPRARAQTTAPRLWAADGDID